MRATKAGSSPSLAIEWKIRGWASIITSITDVSPASAPISTSSFTPPDEPRRRGLPRPNRWRRPSAPGRQHRLVGHQPDHHERHQHVERSCRWPATRGCRWACRAAAARDSCAAVDTASKPMYAKKITAAPRMTPLHPYSPKVPVLGGMNGCGSPAGGSRRPPAMTSSTTLTLMTTMTAFNVADSLDADDQQRRDQNRDDHRRQVEDRRHRVAAATATRVPGAALSAGGGRCPIVA